MKPRIFYFCCVIYHCALIVWFYCVAWLRQWEPSGIVQNLGFGACALITMVFLNELARRLDFFLFSYRLHHWLRNVKPFPEISAGTFWLLKIAQLVCIMGISGALLFYGDNLPFLVKGYAFFALGLLVFAALDFLIHGYKKYRSNRNEGKWMSHLKFYGVATRSRRRFFH